MRPPCEIIVKMYLPRLRRLVARELSESYNYTQEKVAQTLGLTQASVSKYLSNMKLRETDSSFEDIAKNLARSIDLSDIGPKEIILELCKSCFSLREGSFVCREHKRILPLGDECNVCTELRILDSMEISERSYVLSNMERAVSLLEKSETFSVLMPKLRVNLAMAVPDAHDVMEVAGIPGRIVLVRGKPKAVERPAFNVSHHIALVLLTIMKFDSNKRAVMNARYDEEINRACQELNLSVSEFNRENAPKEIIDIETWGMTSAIEMVNGIVPDCICDIGAFGIEPCMYITGNDAEDVVRKALDIADELSQFNE
ncbi:thiamine-phosphate synthase family protein [Candidatus Borrarchaeum sp.]|uniref:thiamine-phosphate synthase family protein n=1 Tax=Candidatus Borrarchaeum sp. TaxID=2846742 RepID=UPI00257ED7B7|nr:thiamine-phosphate synthase family protein [Candidatus Borrarchaeum sp.]